MPWSLEIYNVILVVTSQHPEWGVDPTDTVEG